MVMMQRKTFMDLFLEGNKKKLRYSWIDVGSFSFPDTHILLSKVCFVLVITNTDGRILEIPYKCWEERLDEMKEFLI